ncbi:MFS transporter [Amphibiibacter pelophylacis]|uniref:MFS transporter n=1 Tax=Amphibiibacter pelophylacis TaxID=1799477 RepID=A0ACC6NZZ6_9BURK
MKSLQAHHRVFAGFFLYSFCLGGFFPRLAELQRTMGVTEGQLGLGLIGTAMGTLISLTFGGRWIERLGHRRVLLWLTPIVPAFYAVASHATGPLALFLCLLPAGLLIGLIEIVVNLEADRVEHQGGVRIMNRAHAFWSFGFFGAGLIGTLAARVGLSPQWHLALVVPLAAVLTMLLLSGFQPAPHREAQDAPPEAAHVVRPSRTILLLVALVMSAMVMEGAGIDWSAIYMRDVFGASAVVSGLAVTLGAMSQALARYFADGYVERYSPIVVARTLLVTLLIGVVLVFFAAAPWMALLGFALMGVGTSVMFPLAMSAAAQLTDKPAAVNVAALAQTSFVSFLLAPPLLGFVAQHAGIRWTFGIGLPLVLLSLALSGILRRRA